MNPLINFGSRSIARPRTQDSKTHKNADIHPYLQRNSNPRSQCRSGSRPYALYTARAEIDW